MFVVNFDFSNHILPLQLLAINIPVILTEIAAYPLQRVQTLQMLQKNPLPTNQLQQIKITLKNMLSIEGVPKLLNGMRYSVDYMATQMTTKFLVFDLLISQTLISSSQKWKIIGSCLTANLLGTLMSQIAYNYQTIASSLPIDKNNRPENVRIKLENYTKTNKIPLKGLVNTLPISAINTVLELAILNYTTQIFSKQNRYSYVWSDFVSAFAVFTTTGLFSHWAFQRQVQICNNLPKRSIAYTKGLLSSLLRYNVKGLALFGLYMAYFELKTKRQIQGMYEKRSYLDNPMQYRK